MTSSISAIAVNDSTHTPSPAWGGKVGEGQASVNKLREIPTGNQELAAKLNASTRMNSKRLPATPVARIAESVLLIRSQKVLLDADLAAIYGVETRRLNEQVRRNRERFPADFIFELTPEEFANLKSQFATSSWGGRRKLPMAFTEHGAIMAATILNSPRSVEISVYVVRAFVELRELLAGNRELAQRLDELESRIEHKLESHDQAIAGILNAIRELMKPPQTKQRPIGFVTPSEKKKG